MATREKVREATKRTAKKAESHLGKEKGKAQREMDKKDPKGAPPVRNTRQKG
jgi:hypothetical protein